MWIRKRFDISDWDLLWAFSRSLMPGFEPNIRASSSELPEPGLELRTLSVRSGFDLLLSAMDWPVGSEIIMSGMTIPDMPRIVEEHGLVPVGVEIDLTTLASTAQDVEKAITKQTRAIVVAHLFGGLCDLDAIAAIARRHNLMLLEDCAQAWVGNHQSGDPRADVSMFSFGPIKTNTALAGAVFEVRQAALLARMERIHQSWPQQSRWTFIKRVCKYALLKKVATRPAMAVLVRLARCFGRTHDGFISSAARGFPGPGFFRKIRQRPAQPLLKLLDRKLSRFDAGQVRARQTCGQGIAQRLARQLPVPGISAIRQTWWVIGVLVDDPVALVEVMWRAGFDATRNCSLKPVGDAELPNANLFLEHLVFLPFGMEMPAGELDRMVTLVLESGAQPPAWCEGVASPFQIGPVAASQNVDRPCRRTVGE